MKSFKEMLEASKSNISPSIKNLQAKLKAFNEDPYIDNGDITVTAQYANIKFMEKLFKDSGFTDIKKPHLDSEVIANDPDGGRVQWLKSDRFHIRIIK